MDQLVYLAGPITGLSFGEATDWRKEVKSAVLPFIKTISPLRAKAYLKGDAAIKDSYTEYPMSTGKSINRRDHNDVKRAQAVFVNLLGAKEKSTGTIMEIAWAKAYGVPCIIVMEKDNVHQHAMVVDSADFICDTLEMGIEILTCVLGTDKQVDEYFGRKHRMEKEKAAQQKTQPVQAGQPKSSPLQEAMDRLKRQQQIPTIPDYSKIIKDYWEKRLQGNKPLSTPWDQRKNYVFGVDPIKNDGNDLASTFRSMYNPATSSFTTQNLNGHKMQTDEEFEAEVAQALRKQFPGIDIQVDYLVH